MHEIIKKKKDMNKVNSIVTINVIMHDIYEKEIAFNEIN